MFNCLVTESTEELVRLERSTIFTLNREKIKILYLIKQNHYKQSRIIFDYWGLFISKIGVLGNKESIEEVVEWGL